MNLKGTSGDVVSCIEGHDLYNSKTLGDLHGSAIFDDRDTHYSFKAKLDVEVYGITCIESIMAGEINNYIIT